MPNLLICDDEQDIINALKIYLSDPAYTIFEAHNGLEAIALLEQEEIHLILLDVMMPQLDGISALAEIRGRSNIPVILLTAKSEDADIILGLNIGADDYITKPFRPLEVCARVRSQLRRYLTLGGGTSGPAQLTVGGISLDDAAKKVTVDGEPVSLTRTEYEILKLFMATPGRVYAPREIYGLIWKEKSLGADNTVAVHIRHLREKIEFDPAQPRYIKVIFGQGYLMEKGR